MQEPSAWQPKMDGWGVCGEEKKKSMGLRAGEVR